MAEFKNMVNKMNKQWEFKQDLWIDEREIEIKDITWINIPQLKQEIAIQT